MMQAASDELLRRDTFENPVARFRIGDRVIEQTGRAGTVTDIYRHEDQYRCVVEVDDRSEIVCFEFELRKKTL